MFLSKFGTIGTKGERGARGVSVSSINFDRANSQIVTTYSNGATATTSFDYDETSFGTLTNPIDEAFLTKNRQPILVNGDGVLATNVSIITALFNPIVDQGSLNFRFNHDSVDTVFASVRANYISDPETNINPEDISVIKQTQNEDESYSYAVDINQVVVLLCAYCDNINTSIDSITKYSYKSNTFSAILTSFSDFDAENDAHNEYSIGQNKVSAPFVFTQGESAVKFYTDAINCELMTFNNPISLQFFASSEGTLVDGDSLTVKIMRSGYGSPWNWNEIASKTITYNEEADGEGMHGNFWYSTVQTTIPCTDPESLTLGTYDNLAVIVIPNSNTCSLVGLIQVRCNFVYGSVAEHPLDE